MNHLVSHCDNVAVQHGRKAAASKGQNALSCDARHVGGLDA